MGIQVEFNPDLALRNFAESKAGRRKKEECLPENMAIGQVYNFLKSGQRNYWLDGEIPLLETAGDAQLSRPRAGIIILESTHFKEEGRTFTKGKYQVTEIFSDDKVHFESYQKINKKDRYIS